MNTDEIYRKYVENIIELGATNERVRTALKRAVKAYRSNVSNALNRFPETADKAKRGREIKEYSIEHMDELVDKTCAAIEENHGHCYKAKTKEDAYEIFDRLVGENKLIVKSKSLTSEEIELRQHLAKRNNDVFETDLGEFITQLLGSRPMHLLAPAINVPREEVAELLEKYTGEKVEPEIAKEVQKVREILREKFCNADIGINGANAISADTGTMFIIENEGNARLSVGLPPVQIALIGMEKVVPTLEDAFLISEVTWRYANYKIPAYVDLISGPSKTGDIEKTTTYGAHGPKELYVIFLDNGRTEMAKDPIMKEALYCMKCGACLYECPVYHVTAGHYGYRYIGGIGTIWDAYTTAGMDKIAPLVYTCTLCSRCKVRCPFKIDTPKMIMELRKRLVKMGNVPPPVREFYKEVTGKEFTV